MPLQSSGAISLKEIRNEFGASSGPISMKDLYRGGSLVPNDAFCHNNTIPSKNNAISFNNFYKTTNGENYTTYTESQTITLPKNVNRVQAQIGSGGSGAGVVIANDGCAWPYQNMFVGYVAGRCGGYCVYTLYLDYEENNKLEINVGKGGASMYKRNSVGHSRNDTYGTGTPTAVTCNGRSTQLVWENETIAKHFTSKPGGNSSVTLIDKNNKKQAYVIMGGGQSVFVRPFYISPWGKNFDASTGRYSAGSIIAAGTHGGKGSVLKIYDANDDPDDRPNGFDGSSWYYVNCNRRNCPDFFPNIINSETRIKNETNQYIGKGGGVVIRGRGKWDTWEVTEATSNKGGDGKVRIRW